MWMAVEVIMVKCIRCKEPIARFSPIPCVCDTYCACDDLERHAEAPRLTASISQQQEDKGDEWVDMVIGSYYRDND